MVEQGPVAAHGAMSPAELDTRRRLLGLSVEELAETIGSTERTARRWIAGRQDIPAALIDRLDQIEREMEIFVDYVTRKATDLLEAGPVTLTRYRTREDLDAGPHAGLPFGAHAMAVAWAYDALSGEGMDVEVVWDDEH